MEPGGSGASGRRRPEFAAEVPAESACGRGQAVGGAGQSTQPLPRCLIGGGPACWAWPLGTRLPLQELFPCGSHTVYRESRARDPAEADAGRAGQRRDPVAQKPPYSWVWDTGVCFKDGGPAERERVRARGADAGRSRVSQGRDETKSQ